MRFLSNQVAWAVLGVLLSGVWWVMTHTGNAAPAPTALPGDATLALSTPASVTLASGEVVRGTVTGAQALCPSWQDALAAGDVTVILPDGRRVSGSDIRTVTAAPATLDGLAALVTTTACGDTLSLHPADQPAP